MGPKKIDAGPVWCPWSALGRISIRPRGPKCEQKEKKKGSRRRKFARGDTERVGHQER